MAFVDKCNLTLIAGNGGDGIVSWRREAHVPEGGPAGGNGGHGGSIYLVGDHNETSLESVKYKKIIRAPHGIKGDIKNMHGKNADHVYLKVPLGTVVIDANTNQVLADVSVHDQAYLIAQGGLGGHGNTHFKSAFNKAPNLYERGELGQEVSVILELKTIADVGIIGKPNAGKSTLLSSFTNAKPKTADYMFTTLNPILGTIYHENQRIVFADIPGLIEDAHLGVGLGFDFLRHIERCFLLIHLISLDENDHEDQDIIKTYQTIQNELSLYKQNLINKPMIIVANKLDAPNAKVNLKKLETFLNQPIIAISALEFTNVNVMLEAVINTYLQAKYTIEKQQKANLDQLPTWQQQLKVKTKTLDQTIQIKQIAEHVYEITGEYLKYWAHRIPLNTQDNLIRFNQKLQTINFSAQLKAAGVQINDTLHIYDVQLQYEE